MSMIGCVNLLDQPLLNGGLNRDRVQRPTHPVAAFTDVEDDFVEDRADAPMRRDDRQCPAPLNHRLSDRVERALIFVERKLVELHVAGFADDGIGIGRECVDAEAAGKSEDLDLGGFAGAGGEDLLAEIARRAMENAGPALAITDILLGLRLVARHYPNIPPAGHRRLHYAIVAVHVAQADLAALLVKLQPRTIAMPRRLIRQEVGLRTSGVHARSFPVFSA